MKVESPRIITLKSVSRADKRYVEYRDRHYTPNRGCVGRQRHYLIFIDQQLFGIISGASSVFQQPARDGFFGIDNGNRIDIIGNIVNNVCFRLEDAPYGMASRILRVWRKRVVEDWEKAYGGKVIGFETFVEPTSRENDRRPRTGSIYRYDGWTKCGMTTGVAKSRSQQSLGAGWSGWSKSRYEPATVKIVLCRRL